MQVKLSGYFYLHLHGFDYIGKYQINKELLGRFICIFEDCYETKEDKKLIQKAVLLQVEAYFTGEASRFSECENENAKCHKFFPHVAAVTRIKLGQRTETAERDLDENPDYYEHSVKKRFRDGNYKKTYVFALYLWLHYFTKYGNYIDTQILNDFPKRRKKLEKELDEIKAEIKLNGFVKIETKDQNNNALDTISASDTDCSYQSAIQDGLKTINLIGFTPYYQSRKILQQSLRLNISNKKQVVLSGLGGSGKTTLALEFAEEKASSYDHIYFFNSASQSTLEQELQNFSVKLGCRIKDPEGRLNFLKSWLCQNENWLLIFDNADETKELKYISELLPYLKLGHVIITTRNYDCTDLGFQKSLLVEEFDKEEALDFLFQRTGFKRTKKSELAAEEIALILGYFPLALEQAGAYMFSEPKVPIHEYLEQIKKDFERAFLRQNAHKMYFIKRASKDEKEKLFKEVVAVTWNKNFETITAINENDSSEVKHQREALKHLIYLSSVMDSSLIPYKWITLGLAQNAPALFSQYESIDNLKFLLEPLYQYSLIRAEGSGYSMHRLVQSVIRQKPARSLLEASATLASKALLECFPQSDEEIYKTEDSIINHCHYLSDSEWLKDSEVQLVLFCNLGHCFFEKGNYINSKILLEDTHRKISKKTEKKFHSLLVKVCRLLGELHTENCDYEKAETYLELYSVKCKKLQPKNPLQLITSIVLMARLYLKQGNYKEAEKLLLKSLKEKNKMKLDNPALEADIYDDLGIIYRYIISYQLSDEYHLKALQIREKLENPYKMRLVYSYINYGHLFYQTGKIDKSHSFYKRALKQQIEELSLKHPETIYTLKAIANIYLTKKNLKTAEKYFKKAELYEKQILPSEHQAFIYTSIGLGNVYFLNNDFDNAEKKYIESLKLRTKFYTLPHPQLIEIHKRLGLLYAKNLECEKSIKHLRIAVMGQKTFRKDENYYKMLGTIGYAYSMTDRKKRAKILMLDALENLEPKKTSHWISVAQLHEKLAELYLGENNTKQSNFHQNLANSLFEPKGN